MDYKRLGKRIREERLRLKLTQAQLAEDIEISDTYMGAIERGERSLTLDTLVRLVNRLGVTVDYLLSDSVSDSDSNIIEQFKQILIIAFKCLEIFVLHICYNLEQLCSTFKFARIRATVLLQPATYLLLL
jgi:transcriptional regulator with XRE-family HTH domain